MSNNKKTSNRKPPYNKGKQYNRKPKFSEAEEKYGNVKWDDTHTNDPAWWNKVHTLYDYATMIPFNRLAGTNYALGQFQYKPKSVMRVNYVPGIGKCTDYTDAPNRAFQEMYAKVYSKTTGAIQFQQVQLAQAIIATASIAQNIALVKRALGTAKLYTAVNRFYPRALLSAMGFQLDDIIENGANYVMALNNVIRSFNQLSIPNDIKVFARQYMLANSVYADEDNAQAQLYVPVPELYYLYSDLGHYDPVTKEYDGKSYCAAVRYPEGFYTKDGITVGEMIDIIYRQIDLIRNSSDYALVSGSLIRAFDQSWFLQIDPVDTAYVQTITPDDPYMSYQIHNANAVGDLEQTKSVEWPFLGSVTYYPNCGISADYVKNISIYTPVLRGLPIVGMPDRTPLLLNTFEKSVNADWIVESTRFMSYWEDNGNLITSSTEFVTSFMLYGITDDGYATNPSKFDSYKEDGTVSGNMSGAVTTVVENLSRFHKVPRFYVGNPEHQIQHMFGDLNLWTTISVEQLTAINRAALLSIFGADK